MKQEWFRKYIINLTPDFEWTDGEIDEISKSLMRVSEINYGSIIQDETPIEEDREKSYSLAKAIDVLDSLARYYFKKLIPQQKQYYYDKSKEFNTDIDFLEPSQYKEKINVNTASLEELEDLDGLGPTSAPALFTYRNSVGYFQTIEEVLEAPGINRGHLNKFKHQVIVKPPSTAISYSSEHFTTFAKDPTFENYVNLIIKHDLNITKYSSSGNDRIQDAIKKEIISICDEYERRNIRPSTIIMPTRSSIIIHQSATLAEIERIHSLAIDDNVFGSLIDDSKYPYFVKELIKLANISIRIVMFFMRYDSDQHYPTDELFAELVAAKARGVDIQIILDQDAEGGLVDSRVINEEAYQFFQQNGISVRYDSVEKATHTKLVLVDKVHVLIGSHNWTAGSFYTYDDTSVYLNTVKLGNHYFEYFKNLWDTYIP